MRKIIFIAVLCFLLMGCSSLKKNATENALSDNSPDNPWHYDENEELEVLRYDTLDAYRITSDGNVEKVADQQHWFSILICKFKTIDPGDINVVLSYGKIKQGVPQRIGYYEDYNPNALIYVFDDRPQSDGTYLFNEDSSSTIIEDMVNAEGRTFLLDFWNNDYLLCYVNCKGFAEAYRTYLCD